MHLSIYTILLLVLYSTFSFLFLPIRAWKKEYKKRAIFLGILSVFFIFVSVVGVFSGLEGEDSGFVIFAPAFCLYLQFIFYLIFKFCIYINKPR